MRDSLSELSLIAPTRSRPVKIKRLSGSPENHASPVNYFSVSYSIESMPASSFCLSITPAFLQSTSTISTPSRGSWCSSQ